MKCQDCQKREAMVHMTQIINNEKTTLHLCQKCALARGFHSPLDSVPFPLADLLDGIAATPPKPGELSQVDDGPKLVCSNCGLEFNEFTKQGRFGCGECYKAFRPRLEQIMRKIHGNSLHRGRSPILNQENLDNTDVLPVKEEERLEEELTKAIEAEDFERAAEIRDKLKTIRENLSLENK
jgi:protein arginine kinase activator